VAKIFVNDAGYVCVFSMWIYPKIFSLFSDGKLTLEGATNVYMHTASKYDDCRSLHFPHATCNVKFDWECLGNPHDHHSLMPCLPVRVPPSSNNYDTYANFRSKSLDWSIDVDVKNVDNDVSVCCFIELSETCILGTLHACVFVVSTFPVMAILLHSCSKEVHIIHTGG